MKLKEFVEKAINNRVVVRISATHLQVTPNHKVSINGRAIDIIEEQKLGCAMYEVDGDNDIPFVKYDDTIEVQVLCHQWVQIEL